jgi:hypothetical protein
MMLAAVETVTKADPVWASRRHNPDVAAQTTAGESVHAAFPPNQTVGTVRTYAAGEVRRRPRAKIAPGLEWGTMIDASGGSFFFEPIQKQTPPRWLHRDGDRVMTEVVAGERNDRADIR